MRARHVVILALLAAVSFGFIGGVRAPSNWCLLDSCLLDGGLLK